MTYNNLLEQKICRLGWCGIRRRPVLFCFV